MLFFFFLKPSKNNLHHLFLSFRSIFLFSSVMYLQYTPSSKRNLSSKIIEKSEAVYFFHVSLFSDYQERFYMLFLDDQECVSVRSELVTLVKSHLVGVHNLLIATESGNGHQHRGFRKMEV